jgi:hypothetical protein
MFGLVKSILVDLMVEWHVKLVDGAEMKQQVKVRGAGHICIKPELTMVIFRCLSECL